MDSTTKWLIRSASIVVIFASFTGVFKMLGLLDKDRITSETKVTFDLDKVRNTGNICPDGFAYTGAGYCREVRCGDANGHDKRLGGKGWSCKGKGWLYSNLMFKGETVRATTDERCPLIEPEIGRNNSCQNGLTEREILNSEGLAGKSNL